MQAFNIQSAQVPTADLTAPELYLHDVTDSYCSVLEYYDEAHNETENSPLQTMMNRPEVHSAMEKVVNESCMKVRTVTNVAMLSIEMQLLDCIIAYF